jgi:NAD(P)-dependent dehydrogenase (short-subunit alcohol dehydrogenase family)
MSVEDWHAVLRINLSGTFSMSQPVLAHMLERGSGRIINISSINAVTPGLIETEMTAAVTAKVVESLKAAIPVRRMGRPAEVARVVGFLAADDSSSITGQVWGVTGGLDM